MSQLAAVPDQDRKPIRDFIAAALTTDALDDEVKGLLTEADGRYHPTVVAGTLRGYVTTLIEETNSEDWYAVAAELMADKRSEIDGVEILYPNDLDELAVTRASEGRREAEGVVFLDEYSQLVAAERAAVNAGPGRFAIPAATATRRDHAHGRAPRFRLYRLL